MNSSIVPIERIEKKIFLIRNQKIMLNSDIAKPYGTETKILNKAVSRNQDRFPKDFMFQLTSEEWSSLKFHSGTSKKGRGGRRFLPYAFTEQGIAMLSSVLNSKRAIQINIQIMRAFVKLREILSTHKELAQKLKKLELKIDSHDQQIQTIFEVINQLLTTRKKPIRKIGFTIEE
ncbi:MAG: ORF6N domain-containing protein [Bacteroidetes bacterium]|nr:ORF6N domain-containing protein [Bacteroidota bacterium]MCH7769512.1 ORF6N domain-containing protein [Bacteroidota bacterium]